MAVSGRVVFLDENAQPVVAMDIPPQAMSIQIEQASQMGAEELKTITQLYNSCWAAAEIAIDDGVNPRRSRRIDSVGL